MDGDQQTVSRGQEITPQEAARLLDSLSEIIARASAATLATAFADVERWIKPDQSPVTAADEASEAIILDGVNRLLPGIPVVAEESVARLSAASLEPSFISVDPLDGTKEFLAGRDEYTVNIAVVTHGVPIAGLITAPKKGLLWRGIIGIRAERLQLEIDGTKASVHTPSPIHARKAPKQLTVATSRSHLDKDSENFLARFSVGERFPCGSSVKFCFIAQGDVDIYPRLAPTHEWDIAAGHAILTAAGGTVTAPDGGAIRFGQMEQKFLIPGFIAWGDPALTAATKL